jgi:hypothetical protein
VRPAFVFGRSQTSQFLRERARFYFLLQRISRPALLSLPSRRLLAASPLDRSPSQGPRRLGQDGCPPQPAGPALPAQVQGTIEERIGFTAGVISPRQVVAQLPYPPIARPALPRVGLRHGRLASNVFQLLSTVAQGRRFSPPQRIGSSAVASEIAVGLFDPDQPNPARGGTFRYCLTIAELTLVPPPTWMMCARSLISRQLQGRDPT